MRKRLIAKITVYPPGVTINKADHVLSVYYIDNKHVQIDKISVVNRDKSEHIIKTKIFDKYMEGRQLMGMIGMPAHHLYRYNQCISFFVCEPVFKGSL